jgi:hypothetical protein
MAKTELKKVIRAPREKVIEYFGNPELYFSVHSHNDTSFKIVSRHENEVLVNAKREIRGRPFNSTYRIVLRLPYRIDSETLLGVDKGSKQTTTFEVVPEGTMVTYTSNIKIEFGGIAGKALLKLGGKWLKKITEDEVKEAAEVDRKYLEGK